MIIKSLQTLSNFEGLELVSVYNDAGENLFTHSILADNSPLLRSLENLSKSVSRSRNSGHQARDIHLKIGKNEFFARGFGNGYFIFIVKKDIDFDLLEGDIQKALPEIENVIKRGGLIEIGEVAEAKEEPVKEEIPIESPPEPEPKEEKQKPAEKKEEVDEKELVWHRFEVTLDNIFTSEEGTIGIDKDIIEEWKQKYSLRKLHEVDVLMPSGEHVRIEVSERNNLGKKARFAPKDARKYGLEAEEIVKVHPLLV